MTFKQKVYQHFLSLLNDKIITLQITLHELHESAKNESKSTAGDKHETALAMLQIEQENTRIKYADAIEQKAQLEKINIDSNSFQIIKGSLIKTDKGYFFISLGLGKRLIEAIPVFAISPESPLGAKMLGLKAKDTAEVNGQSYIVEAII